MSSMIIAIDFDGTVVEHEYPEVGADVPGAEYWIKRFQQESARIILWTMRCNGAHRTQPHLQHAIDWFESRGITLFAVNCNPEQVAWTESPKAYAHCYIDDAAVGCPLIASSGKRMMCDWPVIGPDVMQRIISHSNKGSADDALLRTSELLGERRV